MKTPCLADLLYTGSHEMSIGREPFSSDRLIYLNVLAVSVFESIYDLQEKFYEQDMTAAATLATEVPAELEV